MFKLLKQQNRVSLEQTRSHKQHYFAVALLTSVFVLLEMGIMLNAFEAHVVNVTAKIENYAASCPAYSIDEWRDYQGCTGGTGSSVWASEVNQLSSGLSNYFANYTGEMICQSLVLAECKDLDGKEKAICWANAHALVNELNLVSNRLVPGALVAGGYDGHPSFARLGVSAGSTVLEVVTLTESILANASSTTQKINDAMYVSRRVHHFYNYENPTKPQCVFDLNALPAIEILPELEVEVEATSTEEIIREDVATTTEEVATTTEENITPIEIDLPDEEVSTTTEEEIVIEEEIVTEEEEEAVEENIEEEIVEEETEIEEEVEEIVEEEEVEEQTEESETVDPLQ